MRQKISDLKKEIKSYHESNIDLSNHLDFLANKNSQLTNDLITQTNINDKIEKENFDFKKVIISQREDLEKAKRQIYYYKQIISNYSGLDEL